MPGNAFVRFKAAGRSVVGESQQKSHPGKDGWIEVGDWDWSVTAETSFMKGGGSAVGKATPGELSFTHYYDTSSKGLFMSIIRGTHFDEVELVMLKQTGALVPQEYFKLKASSVFTTEVATKGGEDGSVSQDVKLVFKKVEIEYFVQNDKGELKTTNKWEWDIAKMECSGG